ncbi:MAG TPA: amidohydrolase family protein [Dongiaceae bacterium]|nr:amidohydrolase family protein [Dongiaceae bacterium]
MRRSNRLAVMSGFLGFLGLTLTLGGCSKRPGDIAITHVTVIDGNGGPALADRTVLISGARISAVGAASSLALPAGAKIVDGRGKFLIPGLADMHVHLTGAGEPGGSREFILPLLVANGITTVRDMGGKVELLKGLREEFASGKRIGPQIFFTGPYLDGNPPSFQPSIVVQNAAEATTAVDQLQSQGVDFIKVQSRLQPEAYFAIASEAKKLGIRFVGHVPDSITAAQASDAGQTSIEHLTGVLLGISDKEAELREEKLKKIEGESAEDARKRNRLWLQKLLGSISPSRTDNLIAKFAQNRTWQVPTFPMLVHLGYVTPKTDLGADWRLRYVPQSVQAIWRQGRREQLEGYESEDFTEREEIVRQSIAVAGKMSAAGVPIMAGTDIAAPNVFPGFSLHEDLEYMVKAGLTSMQALQAATTKPAEFLGLSTEQGTIEAGKRADLVLLDADPLADIRNTEKIRAVIVNGRLLDRRELDRMLAGVEGYAAKH